MAKRRKFDADVFGFDTAKMCDQGKQQILVEIFQLMWRDLRVSVTSLKYKSFSHCFHTILNHKQNQLAQLLYFCLVE